MKISQAEKKVFENNEVKQRKQKGYYLSSLMLIEEDFKTISSWHFVFYNPNTKNVFTVEVDENTVNVGKESKPLIEEHYEKLNTEGIKPLKILEIVQEEAKKAGQTKVSKILLTLREGVWRAAVTTKDLKMLRIDIKQNSHDVRKTEVTSMLR